MDGSGPVVLPDDGGGCAARCGALQKRWWSAGELQLRSAVLADAGVVRRDSAAPTASTFHHPRPVRAVALMHRRVGDAANVATHLHRLAQRLDAPVMFDLEAAVLETGDSPDAFRRVNIAVLDCGFYR